MGMLRFANGKEQSGDVTGTLAMIVLSRFLEQVEWDKVVEVYLSGIVDEDEMALIAWALRASVREGVEFV
jgi:hypothetical protein